VTITVVAAIIRRGSQILITRRFDDVHLPGYWEFPGGKVEPGESLEFALEREIREELGVTIRIEGEYFSVEHTYPSRIVRIHFFNCSLLSGEPTALQVADMLWVKPVELGQFQFPAADEELIKRLQTSDSR
jgi:8-oxo-dGTP diphosphatase/A/G-specific adenine glycosylase